MTASGTYTQRQSHVAKEQNKLTKKQINKEKAKVRMRKTHSMYTMFTKRETSRSQTRTVNLRNLSSQDHTTYILFVITVYTDVITVYTEDQFLYIQKKYMKLINNMFQFIPSYDNDLYIDKK